MTCGIATLVRPEQPLNTGPYDGFSILVTLSGITRVDNPLQFSNAPRFKLVTLSGIVMQVKLLHPEKAYSPILVTVSLITTLVIVV